MDTREKENKNESIKSETMMDDPQIHIQEKKMQARKKE